MKNYIKKTCNSLLPLQLVKFIKKYNKTTRPITVY